MKAIFYSVAAYGFTRMLMTDDIKMVICYGLIFSMAGTLALCGHRLDSD